MKKKLLSAALTALLGILVMVAIIACQSPISTATPIPTPTLPVTMGLTLEPGPIGSIGSRGIPEFITDDLLKNYKIEPYLAGNLLFIAHWDGYAKRWHVYDVAGNFSQEQLTPPPGVTIPPDPEIGMLYELERGKFYNFQVRSDQIVNIVEGDIGDWYFNAGPNFLEWRR